FLLRTWAEFARLLMLRVPSRMEGLRRLDRNSGLPHRPATAIADEIAVSTEDSYSVALWRAHIERALRAAKTLRAGTPVPRLALRDPFAVRALVAVLGVGAVFACGGGAAEREGEEGYGGGVGGGGREEAGLFPHGCWGEPPSLPGAPASNSAGSAARRAGTDRHRALGAGGKHTGHPRDRNSPRCGHKRRAC